MVPSLALGYPDCDLAVTIAWLVKRILNGFDRAGMLLLF
jgi:hypothetical protein